FSSLNVNKLVRPELNMNCLVYALKQAKIDDKIIDLYRVHCISRYQKIKLIDEVSKSCNIRIQVKSGELVRKCHANTIMKSIGSISKDAIEINLFLYRDTNMKGDHYFLDIDLPITPFYLKNREELNKYALENNLSIDNMFDKQRKKGNNCYTKPGAKDTIKFSELILYIRDHNGFKSYSLSDVLHLPSDLSDYVSNNLESLEYLDYEVKDIKLESKNKKFKQKILPTYYYADFEASTQRIHQAYCVSYSKRNSNQICNKYGNKCVEEFLNELNNNSVIYFHNLKYDSCFLAEYGINKCIKKDGKTMKINLIYNKKKITFKDSYSMISTALNQFPKMFGLRNLQKELYPYNYYTQERIQNNIGTISEAGEYEIQKWTEAEYKLFNENIYKIESCKIDENHFNMMLYCKLYCNQDVRILKEGHTQFRIDNLSSLNIDVDKFISISALAYNYFTTHVYSKIKDLKQYSGKVREYIQGTVYGGRCMTRDNKKWHVRDELYDYDACSLYPSAIHRLKLATGKPILIPKNLLNSTILNHIMLEQRLEPTNERYI
ncbi:hypothetical protein EIN_071460, partial [Entamoeba invadens IP1]